ncbi:MAG: GerMN domain-containing protein [Brevinematales bacterium]
MAEKTKRSRRRRKSSRYLPLLWLLTGALLALVLVLSGNIAIESTAKIASQKTSQNNPSSSPKTTLPQEKKSQKITKEVSIYLARQLDRGVRLVPHTVSIEEGEGILQATLETLLNAREYDDLNLIPPDTKIKRLWIKDGYAHIDLSEEFSYNAYGVQGYKLQIYQIVLTVCQFSHIKGVYFYLEGKPLRYLGGEGFPIPQPVLPPQKPFEIPY